MVQFSHLSHLARKELVEYLDQYSGTKCLVWDPELTGPMDLVANPEFLRARQVEHMWPIKRAKLPKCPAENMVFVCRPQIGLMDQIAEHVKDEEQTGGTGEGNQRTEFHLLFVPHRSLLCERRLKDKGVFGSFTFIDELQIFWYPLETDVISLEKRQVFHDYHLKGDPTALHSVAQAMMAFQAVYGVIPHVFGKGRAAKQIFDFIVRMRRENQGQETQVVPKFDTLIILDRQIDLMSPLVTQLTYEGLIDELFGIRTNHVRLPSHRFATSEPSERASSPKPQDPYKKIPLSSEEEMYAELRDKNFNAVGPTLSKKAKVMSAQLEEKKEASVREMRDFVLERFRTVLATKASLSTHTTIAEMIKEETDRKPFLEALQVEQELLNFQNADRPIDLVEDAACREEDLVRVLRLVCLQSVVNSGLKPKVLEGYRRLLLQSYGYKHLLSLANLEKVGLFAGQSAGGSRSYVVLRKRLRLTLDDIDEQNPTDAAYVHSVYAPLTVRLVERFMYQPPAVIKQNVTGMGGPGAGWRAIRDVLDLLPGPTLEEKQALPAGVKRQPQQSKRTLVLFVGGCTFAEISALRFLSDQEDSPMEIMVATTSMISGSTFLETLMSREVTEP